MAADTQPDRAVRDREATEITSLSKSRRHELSKLGLFPKKVKLGPRASAYRLSELQNWLESRPRADGSADELGDGARTAA